MASQPSNASRPLQLSRETPQANVIRAWDPGRVRVGERWIEGPLILTADRIIEDWQAPAAGALEVAHLAAAIELEPEIILLGTGEERVLPDIGLMADLAAQRIGLEIMTTAAACRTFNVLVGEHRRVVAVLLNPRD
jgi:uncharacterized protein